MSVKLKSAYASNNIDSINDFLQNNIKKKSTFGGDIQVANEQKEKEIGYKITYSGLSQKECEGLVKKVDDKFLRVSVNGKVVKKSDNLKEGCSERN